MTKGVSVKEAQGAVVGLLHEEASDSSRMDHNRSNREGMEKREPAGDGVARQSQNFNMNNSYGPMSVFRRRRLSTTLCSHAQSERLQCLRCIWWLRYWFHQFFKQTAQ
jgi:hypothetical protein